MRRTLKRIKASWQFFTRLPVIQPIAAGSPFHHSFPELAAAGVMREAYILAQCAGKSVLHFGFLDAPFLEQKVTRGELLHTQIKAVGRELYGVDIDAASLAAYRTLTDDGDNVIWDVQAPLLGEALTALGQPEQRRFELIVFSEVLEHLLNPGQALSSLRDLCRLHGCRLLVTVPNALSVVGFSNALHGIENVHPDHYHYYSPYTLRRALLDSGFTQVELLLYGSHETLASPGLTKNGVIALAQVA